MNWTGGRLQRSRAANKGVIQRQKAHFARAKAQLQDSASTDTSPHRPSFFRDERVSQHHKLPKLSSPHNSRHAGQIATLQGPDKTASWPAHRTVAENGLLHGSEQYGTMAERHTRGELVLLFFTDHMHAPCHAILLMFLLGRHSQRQMPSDNDPEERLLETRRKRLLQQSNWAGLAQVQSHELDDNTKRDRGQIGKRRKTRHDHALTRLVPHPLRATASRQPGSALQKTRGEEEIRIRVGTDALSNTTPALKSPSPSRQNLTLYSASSDSLPTIDDDLHLSTPKPGPQGLDPLCKVVGAQAHVHGFHEQMRGESPRIHQPYNKGCAMEEERPHEKDGLNTLWTGPSRIASVDSGSSHRPDRKAKGMPVCYTARHIVRPSRLTFDKAFNSPEIALMNNASPDDAIGEPNHDHDTTNAASRETGNVVESEAGRAEARSASTEDGPWRAFLPGLADSLSPCMRESSSAFDRTHDGTRDGLSLAFPCLDMKSDPWSQQATDGVRTMANLSSCISDSLPSILRESELHESPDPSPTGAKSQRRCSKRPRNQEDGY